MGKALRPAPVKLVCGFIFRDGKVFSAALKKLTGAFGPVDFQSPPRAFSYTDYYEDEMGPGLLRVFVSFKRLVGPARLVAIKTATNRIESSLSARGRRRVNLDPGYVDHAKLVLATTKDFSHRIYLDKGIFAEVTLSFRGRSFRNLEWTYPDYRTDEYITIFNHIRSLYAKQTAE
jgi:hypothetical protein